MKKGTKVKIVKLYDNEDYQLGDILTYERDCNYFIDVNGDEQMLHPSEYEVIKEDLPRMVEVRDGHQLSKWIKAELLAILPEDINSRFICRDNHNKRICYGWQHMREIPQTKEMTIEEIQKELGYKIKVVE